MRGGLVSFLPSGRLLLLVPSKALTETSKPGPYSLSTHPTHTRTQDYPSKAHLWLCCLPFPAPSALALLPPSTATNLTQAQGALPSITGISAPSVLSSGGSWVAALLHRTKACSPQSSFSEKLLHIQPQDSPFKGPFPSWAWG